MRRRLRAAAGLSDFRLQIAAFQKDRAGAFHFIERSADITRLQLDTAAAVQDDVCS
jgi:hypothetical protein